MIGVAIGLALASSRLLALTAGPMLTALNPAPVVALAPLFIAWLGLGFASKFVIVTIFSVFPILVTTEVGLMGGAAVNRPGADRAMVFQQDALLPWNTLSSAAPASAMLTPSPCASSKWRG